MVKTLLAGTQIEPYNSYQNMKRRIFIAVLISIVLNILIVSMYFSYTSDLNPIDQLLRRNRITEEERAWLEQKGILVYGSDRNSPPLRYVDSESGQYIGLVVDYVNALSIELGIEIKLEPLLWRRALGKLEKGETDFSDMFPSKERGETYLFSDSIYNLRGVIVVGAENQSVKSVNDLKNKVVAVPTGDYAVDFLRSRNPGQEILLTADNYEALESVKSGAADAVVGDEPVLSYFMKKIEGSDDLKLLLKPAYEMECVLAVPKSEKMLVDILNKGIYKLKTEGMMLKIQQKWLGISASFVQAKKAERVLVMLAVFAILMLLVLYVFSQWNRTLKREVTRRTEELILSRNELQITFDGLSHLLAIYDADCIIANANKSFSRYVGMEKSDILNRHCCSLEKSFFEGCDECVVRKSFDSAAGLKVEVSQKGSIYQLSTFPIEQKRTEVQKVLLMVRDITNEKITEKKYLHNNKMAAIGQLAAGMAHEIRNPLGLIRNYSYILRHTLDTSESQLQKSIGLIESSVDKASDIIDNLLNFSRLDNESLEYINITSFIKDILQLEEKIMFKRRISATVQSSDDVYYRINREVLKHIIINLVGNAIDAMPEGGKLTLRIEQQEGMLVIECRDSGVGIAAENIDDIFNPFFTTKQRGRGTGLGLYIVHSDIKRYGGEITVESVPEQGTIFTVNLPMVKGAPYESAERAEITDNR